MTRQAAWPVVAKPWRARYAVSMKLELRYPRSFRKLLALGLILVALPLSLGLIGSALSIRSISDKSVQAVYQASRATQASRTLAENLIAQERAVRQFQVLDDPGLWDAYLVLHRRFGETTEQFASLALAEEQRRELADIVAREASLHAELSQPRTVRPATEVRGRREAIAGQFADLSTAAQAMSAHNSAAIEREVEELRSLAANAERVMQIQLLALLPVAAFLVVGFTRLLAGPIAQLESAIGGLRAGRYERRIEVGGPTDLQAVGEKLDRLRLRLVQLEEQKSRFLRHISHELKTPLTALREGSDLLAEETAGPLTAQQREIVAILIDNSLRLRALIEDLLSYSAADFEQAALRLQVFPLRELAEAVVESQRLAWQARELRIELTVDDLVLNADRERIRTVIDNLLSNAIKYSPPRGTITIRACRADGEALIEVADQGPGIAEADRAHVFDPFYQGRIPAAGAVKGSGLGLSIAQEHVLAHGGRLQALPGPGARFELRLPLQ